MTWLHHLAAVASLSAFAAAIFLDSACVAISCCWALHHGVCFVKVFIRLSALFGCTFTYALA